MFSVILWHCLICVVILAEVIAYTPFTCNTGIYQFNKVITRFNVTQDKCEDKTGEDCFQQCSSFTDIIGQAEGIYDPGLVNITWNFNGEATMYLLRYSIQSLNGIQDIYHTCLQFVGTKEWTHQEWHTVTLQCDLSVYARVQVTLKLPTGSLKSTSKSTTSKTSQHKTTTLSTYNVTALSIVDTEKPGTSTGTPLVTWVTITIVVFVTIFIIAASVYIRRVIKNRANKDLTINSERSNETNNYVTVATNNNFTTSHSEPSVKIISLDSEQHYTRYDSDNISNRDNIETAQSEMNQKEQPIFQCELVHLDSGPEVHTNRARNRHNSDTDPAIHTDTASYQQSTQLDVPMPAHFQKQMIFLNFGDNWED